MKNTVWLWLLMCFGGAVHADVSAEQRDQLLTEAQQRVHQFASNLKSALQAGMMQSGPVGAMAICHTASPSLAASGSTDGWVLGRTSLHVRNPNNTPDVWEQSVLQDFERQLMNGAKISDLVATRIDGDTFRMMKAIPTASVCLSCHGTNIGADVTAKIDEVYPMDQARGYAEGDIRGAFSVKKTLTF